MLSLDDATVRTFLGSSMIVEVATLSPKQHPFVTPLWFVVHGGVMYITTGPDTWAGKNIQQNPHVTLLFHGERGQRPAVALRVRGTASCHRVLPSWPVLLRIAAKYYLSPSGLLTELGNARRWSLRARYYGQVKGGFGHIQVVPDSYELLPQPTG